MNIFLEQLDIVEFVKAGGSGFILKNASSNDYINAIEAVAAGSKVLPPALTGSLFTQIVESALKTGNGIPSNSVQLTNREREIVALISDGMSNKETAERLHIATCTVKSHIHNILEKLALGTRLQIAAFTRKEESARPSSETASPPERTIGSLFRTSSLSIPWSDSPAGAFRVHFLQRTIHRTAI